VVAISERTKYFIIFWLGSIIISRNNFLSAADEIINAKNIWQQNPFLRLKALPNKLSVRALSPLDSGTAKDDRASVTTENTMAINITR